MRLIKVYWSRLCFIKFQIGDEKDILMSERPERFIFSNKWCWGITGCLGIRCRPNSRWFWPHALILSATALNFVSFLWQWWGWFHCTSLSLGVLLSSLMDWWGRGAHFDSVRSKSLWQASFSNSFRRLKTFIQEDFGDLVQLYLLLGVDSIYPCISH